MRHFESRCLWSVSQAMHESNTGRARVFLFTLIIVIVQCAMLDTCLFTLYMIPIFIVDKLDEDPRCCHGPGRTAR